MSFISFVFILKVRFFYYRTWHKVESHLDPAQQIGTYNVYCMHVYCVLDNS